MNSALLIFFAEVDLVMWNGLKMSEVFFEEYGLPMLEKKFPEYTEGVHHQSQKRCRNG